MAAIYTVYTSPTHAQIPNHLPTLIVTPHGQPTNILYSYLHTNYNSENYLLTPSPQGDLCVAKLFPPRRETNTKGSASDPGHGSSNSPRIVRCEASRNLKWTITNTGVMTPIYKLALPSPDSADLPLFQISKPNPKAGFWSMFYFAYAGHNIPPKRIEFGKIQKNQTGANGGGGTRISITGKTIEEKAVWQTLGEGNEDCVEWVVLCAALNLLDDEILKAAENKLPMGGGASPSPVSAGGSSGRPTPVSLRDPGPGAISATPPQQRGPPPPGARGPPPSQNGFAGGPRPLMPPGGPGSMPAGPQRGFSSPDPRMPPPPGGPGGFSPPPGGMGGPGFMPGPGPVGPMSGPAPGPSQRGPMQGPSPVRRF